MKKIICIALIGLISFSVKAQYKHFGDSLSNLKKQGKLTGDEQYYNPKGTKGLHISNLAKKGSNGNNNVMSSTACNCWIPRDTSFHPVPLDGSGSSTGPGSYPNYANDDWSTNPIVLPFNFCFYNNTMGNSANPLYINNNGNISFGAAYSTFSAVAFPSATYTMVAPFWSDVDSDGPNSRFVWYKLTPTYLIIQWDSVGYYQAHDDKLNTYQLIITDGNDPILPSGNNISFCYGDMQWTTGDASQGTNGFGGVPATVGINKGDGTSYFQISLFDNNGNTFTNPAGSPTASGVNWLDYKSFYLNACGSGNNLAPLPTGGVSPCGQDTLNICAVGDVLTQTVSFTPPESNQSVSITASASTVGAGFSIVNSTSGVNASLTFAVNSASLTPGFYPVTVIGTDNGSPALSTTLTYVVHVLNTPIPNPTVTVAPPITCGTTPPIITLTNSNDYDSYSWSTGATTFTTSVAVTTTVQITVTKNGCSKTGSAVAQIYPSPSISINGALNLCPPTISTTIFVNQPVTGGTAPFSYNWDSGASTNDTLHNAAPGTHVVMVTDAHGCKDSASVTITSNTATANPVTISAVGNLCAGTVVLSSSITNGTSYSWQPGAGTASTFTVHAAGNYSLTVGINGCFTSATYSLSNPITPTLTITGDTALCAGNTTTLTVHANPAGTYSYTWYNGSTVMGDSTSQVITTIGNTYSVTGINANTQCQSSLTFTINSYNNPTVTINGNSTMCAALPHDSLTALPVGIHGPYTYSWTPGTVATQTIDATSPHTYSVTITDSKGCKAGASFVVKLSNPTLHLLPSYICPNQATTMHAHGSGTPPLRYVWYPGAIGGANYTTSTPGTYYVTMTDFYGCKDSVPVSVIQNPVPQANFNYAPTPPDENSPVNFSDISTVGSPDSLVWNSWNFGDGNSTSDTATANAHPTHVYATGGTYTVTLIEESDKGCWDTITKVITVEYVIVAPNIITPNGDGLNEFLAFKNLLYFKNNKLWIYNRWGTQLFYDADYKNTWTGKDYSDGTYFYILEVPDKDKTYKGFFESIK